MNRRDTTGGENQPGDSVVHAVQAEEVRIDELLRQSREEAAHRIEDTRKKAALDIVEEKAAVRKEIESRRSEQITRELDEAEALLHRKEAEEAAVIGRARKRREAAVMHIVEAVAGRVNPS
jgi:hypothetical protein